MAQQAKAIGSVSAEKIPFLSLFILIPIMFACSVYANLSFAITDPADYRFFPPFEPHFNANQNWSMGSECYRMAQALVAGRGFSDPFVQPTGPTAWQPPIYPLLLAGLLSICDGSRDVVMAIMVFLQVFVLIGTGLLVVALANCSNMIANRWPSPKVTRGVALVVYLGVVLWNFPACFQRTQDTCLIMLAFDIVIAGFCWCRPLKNWKRAALWGLIGGLCALIGPIVGFSWGAQTAWTGMRERAWSRFALALLFAGLAVAPWTIRNYFVFGRIIPLKSNLAFELYQSQCLEQTGLLTNFKSHPGGLRNEEGKEYLRLGEIGYLDRKWEQFRQSAAADPFDFADRIATRFLGATLWYQPFQDRGQSGQPWVLWLKRLSHPLPFLAFVFLLLTSIWKPLTYPQWIVLGLYAVYLLPYIVISYYERYAQPLLGIKVLLVIWAAERLYSMIGKRDACRAG
jgi:hypothetical protein